MQRALTLLALILFLATSSCDAFLNLEFKFKKKSPDIHKRWQVLQTVSGNQPQPRRWYGNYKTVSKRLADIPKKKKIKLDLVANGVRKTVEKKRQETLQHVLTKGTYFCVISDYLSGFITLYGPSKKAIIWKLFMESHPHLEIEYDIGDKDYLPDVVDASNKGEIAFWGEAGRMKVHKAVDLMQRYPEAHIVHCRWGMTIADISQPLEDHLQGKFESGELDVSKRSGKFTFCSLPLDVWRFIDDESGIISVEEEDLEWKELSFPE